MDNNARAVENANLFMASTCRRSASCCFHTVQQWGRKRKQVAQVEREEWRPAYSFLSEARAKNLFITRNWERQKKVPEARGIFWNQQATQASSGALEKVEKSAEPSGLQRPAHY